MRRIRPLPSYLRDYKRLSRKHYDMTKLDHVVKLIQAGGHEAELKRRYNDHALAGDWAGFRDLHVIGGRRGGWLLFYQIDESINEVTLIRSGSHGELFGF